MFDSYSHKSETVVTPVTRVVEKSISPDKVSEMYKEVRAEVEKSVIQAFRVEGNFLNGIVAEMRENSNDLSHTVFTRFTINGKEYLGKEYIDMVEIKILPKEKLIEKLRAHYAEVISIECIKDAGFKVLSLKSL